MAVLFTHGEIDGKFFRPLFRSRRSLPIGQKPRDLVEFGAELGVPRIIEGHGEQISEDCVATFS